MILHTKYTGSRENDFNIYAYEATPEDEAEGAERGDGGGGLPLPHAAGDRMLRALCLGGCGRGRCGYYAGLRPDLHPYGGQSMTAENGHRNEAIGTTAPP